MKSETKKEHKDGEVSDAFMEVVHKIVTTRPNSYWRDEYGIIHIYGALPDAKTACGLKMLPDGPYMLVPEDDEHHATCPECIMLWKRWSSTR